MLEEVDRIMETESEAQREPMNFLRGRTGGEDTEKETLFQEAPAPQAVQQEAAQAPQQPGSDFAQQRAAMDAAEQCHCFDALPR